MAEIAKQLSAYLSVNPHTRAATNRDVLIMSLEAVHSFVRRHSRPSSGQTLLSVQEPDSVKVRRLLHGSPQPSGCVPTFHVVRAATPNDNLHNNTAEAIWHVHMFPFVSPGCCITPEDEGDDVFIRHS